MDKDFVSVSYEDIIRKCHKLYNHMSAEFSKAWNEAVAQEIRNSKRWWKPFGDDDNTCRHRLWKRGAHMSIKRKTHDLESRVDYIASTVHYQLWNRFPTSLRKSEIEWLESTLKTIEENK